MTCRIFWRSGDDRIVERCIFGSFLTAFLFAFIILSAVLSIGGLGESVRLVGRGMPLPTVLRICVLTLPEVLPWSVPLAALASSLLVFARLASDTELTAMRTCGIGVWTARRMKGVIVTTVWANWSRKYAVFPARWRRSMLGG